MSKHPLLGNLERGLVFVMSAPAGTGKTTLARMLFDEFPQVVVESISCTTRPPRSYEKEGEHYHFLTKQVFDDKREKGEFLEHAEVFDFQYGTLKASVEEQRNKGKHVLLVIDTQGAMQLKEHFNACYIFISPPSLEELKRRLRLRQTESEEELNKRLSWAEKEIEQAESYDYQIINDDLKTAYQVLRSIVIAEEHRTQ